MNAPAPVSATRCPVLTARCANRASPATIAIPPYRDGSVRRPAHRATRPRRQRSRAGTAQLGMQPIRQRHVVPDERLPHRPIHRRIAVIPARRLDRLRLEQRLTRDLHAEAAADPLRLNQGGSREPRMVVRRHASARSDRGIVLLILGSLSGWINVAFGALIGLGSVAYSWPCRCSPLRRRYRPRALVRPRGRRQRRPHPAVKAGSLVR